MKTTPAAEIGNFPQVVCEEFLPARGGTEAQEVDESSKETCAGVNIFWGRRAWFLPYSYP